MKKIFVVILLVGLSSCKKDREPNKIVDALPLKTEEVVYPAHAVQEMTLFRIQEIRVIVTSLNQLTLTNPSLTLLTPAPPSNYTFQLSEAHFGTANCTIQFQDNSTPSPQPIFPVESSTGSVKYVHITANYIGSSSLFSYSDTSDLTVATMGNFNSDLHLTGSMPFTGIGAAAGYSMTFTFVLPGIRVNSKGPRDGSLSVSGNGPGGIISMNLHYDNNHTIDGSMAWDGQQGGIHINDAGIGFVTTTSARIPFN